MTASHLAEIHPLGSFSVHRIGYGAMQLAGPGVFGPSRDRLAAVAVLREAVERGVDHIDTADVYGPHVTDEIASFSPVGPAEGSIAAPVQALAKLRERGLVRHIGLSNVTAAQVAEGRRITEFVAVQNHYNIAHRGDDALIDELATAGIAYVPFFPLGGFTPLQSSALDAVAAKVGATPRQVALAWLLRRSPNILLIPGRSSSAHLRENLASGTVVLGAEERVALDRVMASG